MSNKHLVCFQNNNDSMEDGIRGDKSGGTAASRRR